MEIFSIFINIVIVVLILLGYRQLDKSNRSLEKIKRYSNKVKDDLTQFVEEKTAAMHHLSIDVKVNLKTHNEILKRIKEESLKLKEQEDLISKIQGRLKSYDKELKVLDESAVMVEQNLQRIQDESVFVDQVGKLINKSKDKLAQLERTIPQIHQEFEKKNLASLAELKKGVLSEIRLGQEQISQKTAVAEQKVKEFSSYITNLEAKRDKMSKETEASLGKIFKDLESGALVAKKKMDDEVKLHIKELASVTAESGDKVRGMISSSESKVKELTSSLTQQVTELESRSGETMKNLSLDFRAQMEQITVAAEQKITQLGNSTEESVKNLSVETTAHIEQITAQSGEKVHNLIETSEAAILNRKKSLEESVNRKIQEMSDLARLESDKFNKEVKEIEQSALAYKTRVDSLSNQKIEEIGSHGKKVLTDVKNECGNMERLILENKNSAEHLAQEKLALISGHANEVIEKFRNDVIEVETGYTTRLVEMAEKGEALELQIFDNLKALLKDNTLRFTKESDKNFADLNKRIEDNSQEVMTALNAARERTGKFSEDITAEMEVIQGTFSEKFGNLKKDINSRIEAFIVNNRDKQKALTEELSNLNHFSEEKIARFKNEFSKSIEEITGDVNRFKNSYLEKLKEAAVAGEVEREKLVHTVNSNIDNSRKLLDKNVAALKQDITAVDKLRSDIEQRIKEVKEGFKGDYVEITKGLELFKQEIEKNLSKSSAEMENRVVGQVESRLVEYEALANYKIEKIEEANLDVENLEKNFLQLLDAKKESINREFKEYLAIIEKQRSAEENKTRELIAGLNHEMKTLEGGLLELKTKAYQDVSEKLQVFEDEFFSDLKNRTLSMEDSMNSWQSGVETDIDKLRQKHIAERQQIEALYKKELEEKLHILKVKTEEGIKKLKEFVQTDNNNVKEYAEKLTRNVEKIALDLKEKYTKMRDHVVTDKKSIDENLKGIKLYVSDWKKQLVTEVKEITDAQAEERLVLEQHYSKEMEKQLAHLKAEGKKELDLAAKDFRSTRALLSGEFEKFRQVIGEYEVNLNKEIVTITGNSRKEFDEQISQVRQENEEKAALLDQAIKDQFAGTKNEAVKLAGEVDGICSSIEEKIQTLDGKVAQHQANVLDAFSMNEEKMKEWQSKLDNALSHTSSDFNDGLKTLQKNLNRDIEMISKDFSKQREDLVVSTNEDRNRIRNDLREFNVKLDEFHGELQTKSKDTLVEFKNNYNKLREDINATINHFHSDIQEQLEGFKKSMNDSNSRIESVQKENMIRFEAEYKVLTDKLKDIDKHQQNFVEQTKLFERADKLKIFLKTTIEELKGDIGQLEPEKKKVQAVEAEMVKAKKITEEVNAKLVRFFSEKRRIDSMEKDFKQLIRISNDIDVKLEGVTSAQDVLQEILIKMREVDKMELELENKFQRLEKKESVIASTAKGVDRNFQTLEELGKNLRALEENYQTLPPRIESIKQESKILMENKPKSDVVFKKIGELGSIIENLEERIEKLQSAREWLSRTETRLENLGKEAGDQVKLMQSLIKSETSTKKGAKGAPPQDKRETIIKLAQQGWSVKEIARATNISVGEVELILELAPQK